MGKKTSKQVARLAARILRVDPDDFVVPLYGQLILYNRETGRKIQIPVTDVTELAGCAVSQSEPGDKERASSKTKGKPK